MLAVNVLNSLPIREVLFDTKKQYMRESNTLVHNVGIRHLPREVFLNTKGQYMKE